MSFPAHLQSNLPLLYDFNMWKWWNIILSIPRTHQRHGGHLRILVINNIFLLRFTPRCNASTVRGSSRTSWYDIGSKNRCMTLSEVCGIIKDGKPSTYRTVWKNVARKSRAPIWVSRSHVKAKNITWRLCEDLKATALLKLVYLEQFGHDMSWASFHVLEVMSSPKYLQKRVGYLSAIQSFRPDTEVLMLATNLLKKVSSCLKSATNHVRVDTSYRTWHQPLWPRWLCPFWCFHMSSHHP